MKGSTCGGSQHAILCVLIFGYYPVRDTILLNPTKKLLDKEWFTSQYGSPPIELSTPLILERVIDIKLFAQEGKKMKIDEDPSVRAAIDFVIEKVQREPDSVIGLELRAQVDVLG